MKYITILLVMLTASPVQALQPYTYMRSLEFKARVTAELEIDECEKEHKTDSERRSLVNRKLQELSEQYNVQINVCAYCSRPYGVVKGKSLSHGICPICTQNEYAMMGMLEELPVTHSHDVAVELGKRNEVKNILEGMS